MTLSYCTISSLVSKTCFLCLSNSSWTREPSKMNDHHLIIFTVINISSVRIFYKISLIFYIIIFMREMICCMHLFMISTCCGGKMAELESSSPSSSSSSSLSPPVCLFSTLFSASVSSSSSSDCSVRSLYCTTSYVKDGNEYSLVDLFLYSKKSVYDRFSPYLQGEIYNAVDGDRWSHDFLFEYLREM